MADRVFVSLEMTPGAEMELVTFVIFTEGLGDDRAFKTSIIRQSAEHGSNWNYLFVHSGDILLVLVLI